RSMKQFGRTGSHFQSKRPTPNAQRPTLNFRGSHHHSTDHQSPHTNHIDWYESLRRVDTLCSHVTLIPRTNGGVAKWYGRGLQNRYSRVRFPPPPLLLNTTCETARHFSEFSTKVRGQREMASARSSFP